MSFSSSLLTILVITALACPLYSGALLTPQRHRREEPNYGRHISRLYSCTREWRPVCGTNGQTYSNRCIFCSAMLESHRAFGMKHDGPCKPFYGPGSRPGTLLHRGRHSEPFSDGVKFLGDCTEPSVLYKMETRVLEIVSQL